MTAFDENEVLAQEKVSMKITYIMRYTSYKYAVGALEVMQRARVL